MIYDAEWRARFEEDASLASDLPDIQWLRRVLTRRSHRRYADRPVDVPLLRLLLGTAFSASSKSDFQQASVMNELIGKVVSKIPPVTKNGGKT